MQLNECAVRFFLLTVFICSLVLPAGLRGEEVSKLPPREKKEDAKTADDKGSQQKPFLLDPLTIRDRKPAVIEQASTSTEIKKEKIAEHSDKSLDDVLRMVPGLQVESHRKGYIRTRFRGIDQEKIAILIDGIPISDIYSTDIDISDIPVMNVERIIVNRGAASALYGTRGGVGTINIITRRPAKAETEIKIEYEQYNNITLDFAHGNTLDKFYYWLAGSIQYSGGYKPSAKLTPGKKREWFDKIVPYGLWGYSFDEVTVPAKNDYINDSGLWDQTEHTKVSLSARGGYEFDRYREAGLSVQYNFKTGKTNSFQNNCFTHFHDDSLFWSDPYFQLADNSEIKKAVLRNRTFLWPGIHNLYTTAYGKWGGRRLQIKGNLFSTFKRALQEGYASHDKTYIKDGVFADTVFEPYTEIKSYYSNGFNAIAEWHISESHKLSGSLLLRSDIYHEEQQALSAEESPQISASLFGTGPFPVQHLEALTGTLAAEYEYNYRKRLYCTLGISYDAQYFYEFKNREALYQYEDAYVVKLNSNFLGSRDSLNPVAGVLWEALKDRFLLRGAFSMKTRFPNLSEYSKVVDNYNDNVLKPETSYNLSSGFELLFNDRTLSLRCDYYFSIVDDRIEKIDGGINPPVNIDMVLTQGVETSFKANFKNVFDLFDTDISIFYTYLRARNHADVPDEHVNKGKYLEFTPEHQYGLDIVLKFISGTSLNIWGTWAWGAVTYVQKSIPETTLAEDAVYSRDFFEAVPVNNPLKLNIKITQKFLTHYSVYIMCKNIFDDYNMDPLNPGPGRTFAGGVMMKF